VTRPLHRFAVAAVLATIVLAGCSPIAAEPGSGAPTADDLAPVFGLVTPEAEARLWAGLAAELVERTRARLDPAPARALRHGPRADTAPDVTRDVAGLGAVRELSDVSMEVEARVLRSRMLMGFETVEATPPRGFRHDSRTEIGVCPPPGREFVSGRWNLTHEQTIPSDGGIVTRLEVTISATLTATAADGAVFDVTGIHTHIRRTDTAPDGRTAMVQGSVDASLAGLTADTWSTRVVQALEQRDLEIHTRDEWVRAEGWSYLGTAAMSIDVPRAVQRAQREFERGSPCGGWATVPVEFTNTVLNPAGDIPETRRWSGYVCGDPLGSAWRFTEEAVTFRGPRTDQHEIVPLRGEEAMDVFGVMPRIEAVDDPAPGAAPFRLSFEERWPEGIRAVTHQRIYADVVPAGELCAP